jgi:hypothetical protein
MKMAYKKTDDDHSETVMNQLADSVFALSDEVIVDEVGEAGADANEEAERTRLVLRRTSQSWEQQQCMEHLEDMKSRRKASSLKR